MPTSRLSEKLREMRSISKLPQRKVAAELDIDTATYSKIENGLYIPRREQVIALSKIFNCTEQSLIKLWLADKIYDVVKDEEVAEESLNVVKESILSYGKKKY